MKFTRHLLCASLLCTPVLALADDWVSEQGIAHWCAGVGDESRAQMVGAEGASNAQLVLTSGPERGYLSDVQLTVRSADKQHSASWQAQGPICLLKLPQGSYTVDATYGDEHRTTALNVKPGKAAGKQPVIFNFKPS
ncbi:MAG: hypothetical protein JWN23_2342 [Rhodocyclales bacterium]|nr:hypothetical protein [Rhodocyclales bacterium]